MRKGRIVSTRFSFSASREPRKPEWETFQVERRIGNLVQDALANSGISTDIDWDGRVDLVLSSGIDRFLRYVDILRARVGVNTDLGFRDITGLLVADRLHRNPEDQKAIDRMAADGMYCSEWGVLLDKAEAQWKDFLFALAARAPDDDRVRALTVSELPVVNDLEATDPD